MSATSSKCLLAKPVTYPSTREQAYQRALRRSDKLKDRLGWRDDPNSLHGTKPKGKNWKTFDRLVNKLDHWESTSEVGFLQHLGG